MPEQPAANSLGQVGQLACPKCASEDVATSFHRDRWLCNPHSRFTNNSESGEHLHYTCRTCQYDWTGVTADARPDDGLDALALEWTQ